MKYILWVVLLLEAFDVTNNGRHLGFYQELEIRLKPREMVMFCALHEKKNTQINTLHDFSHKIYMLFTDQSRWITCLFFFYNLDLVSGKFYFSLQPMCVEVGRVRVDEAITCWWWDNHWLLENWLALFIKDWIGELNAITDNNPKSRKLARKN